MSHETGATIVPFTTFLEVRERRASISVPFQEALGEPSGSNMTAPALPVAPATDVAESRREFMGEEAAAVCSTPGGPESPGRGSR